MTAVYYVTIFFSAFLLFLVQPMFPKKLLPIMGGTASLWNTCIFFYQTALFAGYAYSHYSTRYLSARRHGILHLVLIACAAAFLPLSINLDVLSTPTESPIRWVLTTLALTIGPLFFLLSTTAPLVQRWYAAGQGAGSPYHLYAMSNAGSMAALLTYPFIIEPGLTYTHQLSWWSMGYWGFIILISICTGHVVFRGPQQQGSVAEQPAPSDSVPSISDRLWWTVLAFIPSSLLLGVTTHITSDIAAVPLLWVLPLALYLITFILTFGRREFRPGRIVFILQTFLLIFVVINYLTNNDFTLTFIAKGIIGIQLFIFFINAFLCHSELSRRRPAADKLTEFYLFVSLGGALGGLFNVLLAPHLFSRTIEYQIVLLVAYFVTRYDIKKLRSGYKINLAISAIFGIVMLLANRYVFGIANQFALHIFLSFAIIFLAVMMNRYLAFSLCIALLFFGGDVSSRDYLRRSYFGTYSVIKDTALDRNVLFSGNILHGFQFQSSMLRSSPQSYYANDEPFGALYFALKENRPIRSVAVIGLGAGTMAAYADPGQRWVFYEIDPVVLEIASNPEFFTYLSDSKGEVGVIIGDGRVSIEKVPDGYFDLIVVDAFSSDAIPLHLISKEAFELYESKLTDNGIVMYHISNKYLNLSMPLSKLAAVEGKDSRYCSNTSEWFAIAKGAEGLYKLGAVPYCISPSARDEFRLWTDDYASIFSVLR